MSELDDVFDRIHAAREAVIGQLAAREVKVRALIAAVDEAVRCSHEPYDGSLCIDVNRGAWYALRQTREALRG